MTNTVRKPPLKRLISVFLLLVLLLAPGAQALTLEEARALLTQYYVDEIPEQVLRRETIEDVILALGDPYTQYLSPEEYEAFLSSMKDEVVVGIGVSLGGHESGLLIMGTFSGSPAQEAGLAAGDVILSVDGQSTAGENYETAASRIRGEAGTQVTISVLHPDGSLRQYTLTRRPVVIPATTSEQTDGHVCHIVCNTFGAETVGHFWEGIDTYGGSTDCWIVDLRANTGGDVAAATDSLGFFLGEGRMVSLRDGDGMYSGFYSHQASQTMYPLLVLTSRFTASAAEIFVSAVRDYRSGLVIGSRTFGKGVAQIMLDRNTAPDYFDDGSALKITAFRYFSAAGNTADKVGVIPHLLVSEERAADIARLLSASDPLEQTGGTLRVHLGSWRWHINLDQALSEGLRPAFIELLEALPPETELFRGLDGGEWAATTVGELASLNGLAITPRAFADAADSPYQLEINTLRTYAIVRGCGDGLYHPEKAMTRAELCALLAQALNLTPQTGEGAFADVPADAWYAPWVNAMGELGLVQGVGGGLFRPADSMSHEQFITVMARLAARLNVSFYESDLQGPDGETPADSSLAAYSGWAKDAVWLLGKSPRNPLGGELNLLFAPVADIDPAAATCRDEAAALLYSVLVYTGILSL